MINTTRPPTLALYRVYSIFRPQWSTIYTTRFVRPLLISRSSTARLFDHNPPILSHTTSALLTRVLTPTLCPSCYRQLLPQLTHSSHLSWYHISLVPSYLLSPLTSFLHPELPMLMFTIPPDLAFLIYTTAPPDTIVLTTPVLDSTVPDTALGPSSSSTPPRYTRNDNSIQYSRLPHPHLISPLSTAAPLPPHYQHNPHSHRPTYPH